MTEWWTQSTEECLARQGSAAAAGLTQDEADKRLREKGLNILKEAGLKSPWRILWEQLTGILIIILIAAAIISAFLGETADAVVIGIIVILNALLGFSQEFKAEKAMAALKRLAAPRVKVRRNGVVKDEASPHLVPGDIVILETGNLVPADCRLLEAVNLEIGEAALTGESEPVTKTTEALKGASVALGDRLNMAYMGTVVTRGRGVGLVAETGMSTELGGIASMMQTVVRTPTPFQKRLEQLGRGLALAAVVLVAVIFAQGLIRDGTGAENVKKMFMTAISMAVAAVPEGLPAVVTIALALGAQRMLRRKALIRKLLAVETLGSVTVICSDKTGTLTENKMTVTLGYLDGREFALTGPGAGDPAGKPPADRHPALPALLAAGALCNDAEYRKPAGPAAAGGSALGDPTEGALIMAAAGAGLPKDDLEKAMPRMAEWPFDSDRKRMTTLHSRAGAEGPDWLRPLRAPGAAGTPAFAFCKGAADGLLGICRTVWTTTGEQPLDDQRKRDLLAAHDSMAARGMRVLGLAFKRVEKPDPSTVEEKEMVFLGLIGMIDPPRAEVKAAIQRCKAAGIRSVMITGDHPLTAREVARQLDMAESPEVLTGAELDLLSAEQLRERVESVTIYARVSPEHKLKIIEALQQRGHVVAMTGDGVNDAPALRKADIGVAMGITGTDVSKEAADMVLQDDNFTTIVSAVEEGRVIYDNIRKVLKYLLSTNSGELWVMLLAPFVGLPLPLAPIQILWMNLVTDGLPALALGLEPAEKNSMKRPPRRLDIHILGEGLAWHILLAGLLMGVVTLGAGWWHQHNGTYPAGATPLAYFQTLMFTLLTFLQMANILAIRSDRDSLFTQGLLSNKPLAGAIMLTIMLQLILIYTPFFQVVFKTVPLTATDLALCFLASTTLFWAIELQKWIKRKTNPIQSISIEPKVT